MRLLVMCGSLVLCGIGPMMALNRKLSFKVCPVPSAVINESSYNPYKCRVVDRVVAEMFSFIFGHLY